MTRTRSLLLSLAPPLVGVALLLAVRPGVVVNGVRSPVAWAVALGVVLAGVGSRALARRLGAGALASRLVGTVVVLSLLAVVLAPSFRQRTLVEELPAGVALTGGTAADGPRDAGAVTGGAVTGGAGATAAPAAPTGQEPQRRSTGSLEGVGHTASGAISLTELDGQGVVRFQDVDIEGSVEPSVHLVRRGARTPTGGVALGPLKAERGSFSYTLPAAVDLSADWTLLVWCDPFDTPIAAADLG